MPFVGRIFAAQPSYGSGNPNSHKQFWTAALRQGSPYHNRVTLASGGKSLLAYTFNLFWTQALNMQEAGVPVTHFAMLHDDVVPCEGWLDILMEDLLASKVDMVGAVVPIKDPVGLTSTAIDNPGNEFEVERRLTMNEVFGLPKLFGAADCGYPDRKLLLNTGCWVCDFTKPWRHKVRFTINDNIKLVEKDGRRSWVAEAAPEDWNFSRDIQELGGKVMATRRVGLVHMGSLPYSSSEPWGEWEYDRLLAHKFGHKRVPQVFKDEDDFFGLSDTVDGWLSDAEGRLLSKLAKDKRVLEIGSYCGRSTIWLARTAKIVHAIDTFDGRGTPRPRETLQEFHENLTKYGVRDKVVFYKDTSANVIPGLCDRTAPMDLAFIDGAHDHASVKKDCELCLQILAEDGLVAFHDYDCEPGVMRFVDELLADGAERVDKAGSLVAIKPKRPTVIGAWKNIKETVPQ